ncbi:MAG TPA: hypothetical protein VFU43_10335 [Streptosporangiaceae bacterium]|nr:hypothetical protein [Streptosporangiaceae bacterium]
MYGAIWKVLPGDRVSKALFALAIVVGVAALLWYVVFPWAEPKIRFDHGTVDGGGTSAPASPSPGP